MKRGVYKCIPRFFSSFYFLLLLSSFRSLFLFPAHREECLRERVYTIPTTDKTRSLVSPVGKEKNRASRGECPIPASIQRRQFSRRGDSAALPRRKMQLDEETVAQWRLRESFALPTTMNFDGSFSPVGSAFGRNGADLHYAIYARARASERLFVRSLEILRGSLAKDVESVSSFCVSSFLSFLRAFSLSLSFFYIFYLVFFIIAAVSLPTVHNSVTARPYKRDCPCRKHALLQIKMANVW